MVTFHFPEKLPKEWIEAFEHDGKIGSKILDPNFGYETKGGTSANLGSNTLRATKFYCSESGQAQSITVYIKQYSTQTPKIKCAIYADNNGYPGALVGYTEEWTLTSGWDGWKTFNIVSGGSLSPGYYWLVFFSNGVATYYYDAGDTNQFVAASQTYDGFPDTYPSGGTYYARKYSIYCTYTTAAIIKSWTQIGNVTHTFKRPFLFIKLAQNLNTSHVYLRHRFMKLIQALRTLHVWTVIYPGLILKQWVASLNLTHTFKRSFRTMKLIQTIQPVHVFRRPVRLIRLPATLQLTHFFSRPACFMKLIEQLTLGHAYFLAIPSVKKAKLFLVIGDLAIQLSGD
jgi:hypothetical protein